MAVSIAASPRLRRTARSRDVDDLRPEPLPVDMIPLVDIRRDIAALMHVGADDGVVAAASVSDRVPDDRGGRARRADVEVRQSLITNTLQKYVGASKGNRRATVARRYRDIACRRAIDDELIVLVKIRDRILAIGHVKDEGGGATG